MANNRVNAFGQGSTTSTAILTVDAAAVGMGARLMLTNTNASTTRTVTIHVAQDGGAAATANERFPSETLTAQEQRAFTLPPILRKGAIVYLKQDTGTDVNYDIGVTLIPQTASSAA